MCDYLVCRRVHWCPRAWRLSLAGCMCFIQSCVYLSFLRLCCSFLAAGVGALQQESARGLRPWAVSWAVCSSLGSFSRAGWSPLPRSFPLHLCHTLLIRVARHVSVGQAVCDARSSARQKCTSLHFSVLRCFGVHQGALRRRRGSSCERNLYSRHMRVAWRACESIHPL